MNLENLGVQEMSEQEVKQVEGGWLAFTLLFVFCLGRELDLW